MLNLSFEARPIAADMPTNYPARLQIVKIRKCGVEIWDICLLGGSDAPLCPIWPASSGYRLPLANRQHGFVTRLVSIKVPGKLIRPD